MNFPNGDLIRPVLLRAHELSLGTPLNEVQQALTTYTHRFPTLRQVDELPTNEKFDGLLCQSRQF